MASTISPYDFEPVYYYFEWSITESTESDTETEFINTENNQHRVGTVSCHFRILFMPANQQCGSIHTAIECQCCCELSRVTEKINSLGCNGECITNVQRCSVISTDEDIINTHYAVDVSWRFGEMPLYHTLYQTGIIVMGILVL